jgi:hypothetical protein
MPDLPTFNPDYGRDNLRAWWESLAPTISGWASKLPGASPPAAPAPAPSTGSTVVPMGPLAGTAGAAPQAVEPAEPPAAAAPAPTTPGAPEDPKRKRVLEYEAQRTKAQAAIAAAEQAIREDPNSTAAFNAQRDLPAMRALEKSITDSITAEENRLRDEETAKAKEEKDKKDKPTNGQTREVPFDYKLPNGQTVTGIKTEEYQNGVWGYVAGSSRKEPGATPQGAAQITNQVLNDGRGAYWTYDQATGKATPINGPAAAVKTVNDPDGSVWTQNPDGSKGTKLFEGLPQTYEADGFIVGVDRRNGSQVFKVDTKTAEGRALADRLQRANVETAERAGEPKFASAIAQYQQEVQRRQTLARTELQRLQDLQKSGQLSPDQAEAQFDRWMTTNVEGPLSGFRTAAEQERQRQEQENLTRQTAENTRVETANRERGRLGYEAGEAAKAQALEVGLQTRSPAYLAQMGNFAQSLGQGKTDFQFDPKALDVAGFQAVQPNYTAVADQAMQRLFGQMPAATAQNVNSPLPALPTGPDLRSLMDGVKYGGPSASGALSAPIEGDPGLPGQQAVDLKDQGKPGYARTVYANGKYFDWAIPQVGGAAAAPQVAPPTVAPPSLPGQLPGETLEQRRARFYAVPT